MAKNDFDIPRGLSPKGRAAAEKILATVRETLGPNATGGGCRAFYTPKEWRARGELYGTDALLVVVHDGGDLAPFFNLDYGAYKLFDKMWNALEPVGVWAEACTSWYTAVYPS